MTAPYYRMCGHLPRVVRVNVRLQPFAVIGIVCSTVAIAGCATTEQVAAQSPSAQLQTNRVEEPLESGTSVKINLADTQLSIQASQLCDIREVRTNRRGADDDLGDVVESSVPCKHHPKALGVVTLEAARRSVLNQPIRLGSTDERGYLASDIEPKLPDTAVWADSKYVVLIDSNKVGEVDLTPVLTIRESESWNKANIEKCKSPSHSGDCGSVEAFLRQYAGGPHSREAQALLTEQGPMLEKLREREAWSQNDAAACSSGKVEPGYSIEMICDSLARYVASFPDGEHANEARDILNKARTRQDKLDKKDAAEAKKRKDAENRREAQQAAQERSRQVAAIRQECQQGCSVGCSRRWDTALCLNGCIPMCVKQRTQQLDW